MHATIGFVHCRATPVRNPAAHLVAPPRQLFQLNLFRASQILLALAKHGLWLCVKWVCVWQAHGPICKTAQQGGTCHV